MDNKQILRFSDEVYFTKEEVKSDLHISYVDDIFKQIEDYRDKYRQKIDLFYPDLFPFKIALVPGIYDRFTALEHRIISLERNYPKEEHLLHEANLCDILTSFQMIYKVPISDDSLIKHIVKEDDYDIPSVTFLLKNYYKALKEVDFRHASPFNENTIRQFYAILVRGDRELLENTNVYRNDEEHDQSFSLASDRIETNLDHLFEFVLNSKLFPTIVSGITLYSMLLYEPFECFDEEMAILSMKYVLEHNNIHLFDLPYETYILSEEYKEKLKEVMNKSKNYHDPTYFLSYYLDTMNLALDKIEHFIEEEKNNAIINEEYASSDSFYGLDDNNQETIKEEDYNNNHQGSNSLAFHQQVSLPIFPKGLDPNDIEVVIHELMEIYPSLKMNQAHFYAKHCTIGKYYSIQQYKSEENCAYETARTSMDNLAELGFYKKEKIKNRFIYTPVIRE